MRILRRFDAESLEILKIAIFIRTHWTHSIKKVMMRSCRLYLRVGVF
mgnify:CR=1 FL=1|jgi:hypothetical protein